MGEIVGTLVGCGGVVGFWLLGCVACVAAGLTGFVTCAIGVWRAVESAGRLKNTVYTSTAPNPTSPSHTTISTGRGMRLKNESFFMALVAPLKRVERRKGAEVSLRL